MQKILLILAALAMSACGAKSVQFSDRTANGIESVTLRKGVGYENITVARDSTYEYRTCTRKNQLRNDADQYCRCITTPLDKRGPECFMYGYGMYAGGYGYGGYGAQAQFPGAPINAAIGSSYDPRMQVAPATAQVPIASATSTAAPAAVSKQNDDTRREVAELKQDVKRLDDEVGNTMTEVANQSNRLNNVEVVVAAKLPAKKTLPAKKAKPEDNNNPPPLGSK